MGRFIAAEELKALTTVSGLRYLPTETLERLYIDPAEKRLETAFRLDLETSRAIPPISDPEDIPVRLRPHFDQYPDQKAQYFDAMKTAVILLVQRMHLNPDGLRSQTIGGASAEFGRAMPIEIRSLLQRWCEPNLRRIVRT